MTVVRMNQNITGPKTSPNIPQIPRGTNDILPQQIPLWIDIEVKARHILATYGYKEIRTPMFEEIGLFKRSLGQTSDVVNKQLLALASGTDKEEGLAPLASLTSFALRPEGTASVVRSYIENSLHKKENLSKLYYLGPMFRGERPQKGRLRQFHQIGVEVIGPDSASPYLDAEVIALNVNMLKSFGLKNFKLVINTLGSLEDKENFSKILRDALRPHLSQLSKESQNRFDRNVFRVLDSKNKADQAVVSHLKLNYDHLSSESRNYFEQMKRALEDLEIPYEQSATLVRGLDYYTHTVYEITSTALGSQDALSAGGRYNNLVEQLGGPAADAVGFALGIERVLLALLALGGSEEENPLGPKAFIVALDQLALNRAFQILHALRGEGVVCDMNYKLASMKSQMRLADKLQAEYVLILGETEYQKGIVAVKNMKTGEQQEIEATEKNINELANVLLMGKV
jgi:histidyl-tRNA synthetase